MITILYDRSAIKNEQLKADILRDLYDTKAGHAKRCENRALKGRRYLT